ncbi:MAG: hypothetical protein ACFFC7_15915 [Candidatus Hermodarchaeota archaeon]
MKNGEEEDSLLKTQSSNESLKYNHRSQYWYPGSYFIPTDKTYQRLALLQKHAIKNQAILTSRGIKLREIVSVLSEWFPLPLLDTIVPKILSEDKIERGELLCKFLGYLELELRLKGLCISQTVLDEINLAFNTNISKKHIFKWFWVYRRTSKILIDNLSVLKKIAANEIIKSQKPIKNKREALKKLPRIIKDIEKNRIIFQDPEIYGCAVARICLKQIGQRYENRDPRLRKAISKAVFRLRNELCLK